MNKIHKLFFVTILVSFIFPSFALASWWNPFSWFNNWKSSDKQSITEIVDVSTTTQNTDTKNVESGPANTTTSSTQVNEPVVTKTIVKNTSAISTATTTNNIDNCAHIQGTLEKDACYIALSKVTKDSSVCINIIDLEKKNACYLVIANFKKDPKICDLMLDYTGSVNRNMCLNIVDNRNFSTPSATDPKVVLVNSFLENPTLDNFKSFCKEAKNIPGSKIEKTMDSSRENIVSKNLSFYYDLENCVNLDSGDNTYYLPLDINLLLPLKSKDSDWEREAKLLYNEKINYIVNTSIARFVLFESEESIDTPAELFEHYSSKIKEYDDSNEYGSVLNDVNMRRIKRFSDVISAVNIRD